jgi:hypothetical protein
MVGRGRMSPGQLGASRIRSAAHRLQRSGGTKAIGTLLAVFALLAGCVVALPTAASAAAVTVPAANILNVDFAGGTPVDQAQGLTETTVGAPTIGTDTTLNKDVATFDGKTQAYSYDFADEWPTLTSADAVSVECQFQYNGTLPNSYSTASTTGLGLCSDKVTGGLSFSVVGGSLEFQVNVGGVYNQQLYALASGTWYDAVGVYDGSSVTLYVNGAEISSAPVTGTFKPAATGATHFVLGANAATSTLASVQEYAPSQIAAARVWSSALSAGQVSALFAASGNPTTSTSTPPPVTPAPVSSPDVLDVNFANGAPVDHASNLTADVIGTPSVGLDPTLRTNVATFDGKTSAYGFGITGSQWSEITKAVTIECVLRYNGSLPNGGSGTSGPAFCSSKNGSGYGFVLTDGTLHWEANFGGGYTGPTYTLPAGNTWYDVIGTWDGSTLSLYVNGVLVDATGETGTPGIPTAGGQNFNLGADVSATDGAENFIPSSIARARIWSTALTADQVATEFTASGLPNPVTPTSPVVISAVYGGGGTAGSYYANDFVELFNPSTTTAASLKGLSLQYFSADGTLVAADTTALDDVTLSPGQYFLLSGHDDQSGDGSPLNVAADQAAPGFDIDDDGTLALVSGTAAVASPTAGAVIDAVGTGTTASSWGTPAPELSATNGDFRTGTGCTNTYDNGADFVSQVAQTTPLYDTASNPYQCAPPLTAFGESALSPDTGSGEGVATNGNGTLYFTNAYDSAVESMTTSGGSATTLAGGTAAGIGETGDGGPAKSAPLTYPSGIAVDAAGNIYVSDNGDETIREIVKSTGEMIRFAGTAGKGGYTGDGGPATSATIYDPQQLAVDAAGDVFIADSGNNVIREVTPDGNIKTVAGDGTFGYAGDGGPATSAELASPYGVAVDSSGNLYIADSSNNVIRRVDAQTGVITTVAGDHTAYVANDYKPAYSGDGGPATLAQLNDPQGVALNKAGDLFIADTANKAVRIVTPSGQISSMASNPPVQPEGITVDNTTGTVYTADANSGKIDAITGLAPPALTAPGPVAPAQPGTEVPESPVAVALPLVVLVLAGAYAVLRRRRSQVRRN